MSTSLSSLEKRIGALEKKLEQFAPIVKSTRFIDNGNGTVTDKETGLTWQKDTDDKERNWAEAKKYCEENQAKLPGGGWRLPTVKELITIIDYERHDPAIDPVFGARSSWYWSSTPHAGHSGDAWNVSFYFGSVLWGSQSGDRYVRAVRQNS